MIGPSSGTSEMSNCDMGENSVRLKRRNFEDIDIDSFCDEICQSTKKRQLLQSDPIAMAMTGVVHNSQFPIVTTTSELEEVENNNSTTAPVTRLEVLVVDGTWDVSNFTETNLIDLSSATEHHELSSLNDDVENVETNYNTILSYWEPAVSDTDNVQCTNISVNTTTAAAAAATTTTTTEPPKPQITIPTISNNQVEDQENGNLSWLLDFKLDSFIEAAEEKTAIPCPKPRQTTITRTENSNSYLNNNRGNYIVENDPLMQREKQPNSTYTLPDNRIYSGNSYNGPKKPPFTYTELIEHALQERGELTVSAIYQWISEHFPYYKSNDDRWKNSVRHNLSINPHFRKGSKAPHGAGHLWAIANRGDTRPRQLITNLPIQSAQRPSVKTTPENTYARKNIASRPTAMIDEVAAATASITENNDENVLTSVTLEHCAEQILSGIKREVEVQYLLPMTVESSIDQEATQIQQNLQSCDNKETDFLNPVSKEVVAEECGLLGEGYLVTDLNPTALGLNMAEPEIITPDHLFGEELSFQFYELASPSQLQSA